MNKAKLVKKRQKTLLIALITFCNVYMRFKNSRNKFLGRKSCTPCFSPRLAERSCRSFSERCLLPAPTVFWRCCWPDYRLQLALKTSFSPGHSSALPGQFSLEDSAKTLKSPHKLLKTSFHNFYLKIAHV